jgi:hypothetical protein
MLDSPFRRALMNMSSCYLVRDIGMYRQMLLILKFLNNVWWSNLLKRNKYKQNNIIQMLDGLISNIFVLFGGLVYQQTTGGKKKISECQ